MVCTVIVWVGLRITLVFEWFVACGFERVLLLPILDLYRVVCTDIGQDMLHFNDPFL